MIFNKKNIFIAIVILGLSYCGYTYFFKNDTATTTYQTSAAQKGTLIVSLDSSVRSPPLTVER